MQIETSSSRVYEHQSGFPQTRQGLRLLTRANPVDARVGFIVT
jgi:hypothetical protein